MLSHEKKIIIFMSLYRNEDTMHQAIQSILSQTHTNLIFAIFVSDATISTVKKYAEKDKRIIIVEGTVGINNQKFYEIQMDLIRQTKSDYTARLDGDDWCDSRYIETMLDFAQKNGTDIVACGTNFMDNEGKSIVGVRQQNDMVWDTRKTGVAELSRAYRFFGTTWGKLISANTMLNQHIERIPDSSEYGAYGGDTIWVFNLLTETNKLGICNQALYYYRLPGKRKTNHSSQLHPNRLKADEYLYCYVKNALDNIGCLNSFSADYLLLIYATAIQDTTELVLGINISAEERSEKLLFIFENPLTIEFLEKESSNKMIPFEGSNNHLYRDKYYTTLFDYCCGKLLSDTALENYFKIFEILNEKSKGMLSLSEFSLLIEQKKFLDALKNEEYNELFSLLLDSLPMLRNERAEVCLRFLGRLTSSDVLIYTLQDPDFVLRYAYLIKEVQKNNYDAAFSELHRLFAGHKKIRYASKLAEFWSNIGAEKGNANEFILAKESLVEALIHEGDMPSAAEEYNELIDLGVNDEKMISLSKKLS